ncbi:MraZ, putative [Oceaniovalibus guishaninsula JLT2003]|uniref:Transcriptional regulator MraZ n=1 Tax=Oceaniovalibus guishaninsula JLT2003 TaxID=1231392 RepID=K2GRR7_9RHOB|nr:cell division protein MraZ [Oceaniovalibus guishaninsula]EKE45331.1 MraZ, putative [Oceaniovalibus guishaninsula JLT2003]
MFGVFIGEHENKIDAKGRLSIPADFRRELEDGDPKWEPGKNASMLLVYGDHRRSHVEVMKITDMRDVYTKITRMPRGSIKRRDMERLYFQQALTATVDETGRIVLSARVRDKLGLDGTAMVVGNGSTFEIWKPETYAANDLSNLRDEDGYDPDLDPSVYLPGDDGDV